MEAEHEGAGGEADDERLPDDELRHQSEPHPVVGARDAVLHVGDDESRQRQTAEIERHDARRIEPGRQSPDEIGKQQRDQRGDGERHPTAAGQETAQQRIVAAGTIFRNDLLGRGRGAKIHHAAEQQHPGPDVDVDAVVRTAHPARQQDLRDVGKTGADDTDDEDRAGKALGQRRLAGSTQHRAQPSDQAG